jgi:hypothetical protein
VPPPMSITMLPIGSSIGRSAPIAGCHRLLDQLRIGRAGAARRVRHGAPLDLGDRRTARRSRPSVA